MEIPIEQIEQVERGVDPDTVRRIQKGKDLEALFDHRAYKHICDWFEHEANVLLAKMRESHCIESDRYKANLLTKWATTEELFHKFQTAVQDAIEEKNSLVQSIIEEHDEPNTQQLEY